MEKALKTLHIEKKGQVLDTYEGFHVYEISKRNIQLNDNVAETCHPIYDVIIAAYQSIGDEEKQPD
jgi:aspartate 1-decarboxylase